MDSAVLKLRKDLSQFNGIESPQPVILNGLLEFGNARLKGDSAGKDSNAVRGW